MKRSIWMLLLALMFTLVFAAPVLACDLRLTPAVFSAGVGERVTFTLERYQTHNRCLLPLEETSIRVTGGKVVSQGTWRTGQPDILEFTVEFTTPGQAQVLVERDCSKGIFKAAATGTVTAGQAAISAPAAQNPPAAASPDLAAGTEKSASGSTPEETALYGAGGETSAGASSIPSSSAEAGGGEASASRWSKVIGEAGWWLGFMALGLGLFLLRRRRLRLPLLFLSLAILGFYLGGCPDPIGALFNLAAGAGSHAWLFLILLLVPLVISLIWGRVFCGWVCPIGAVQELIYGRRGRRSIVPPRLDKALKYLKYAVLAGAFYLSWRLGRNILSEYEPFKALFNLGGEPWLLAGLGLLLGASLLVERPFCRYLCPLGAIFTLTSMLAPRRVRLDVGACTSCRSCTKEACPMGALQAGGAKEPPSLDSGECIACGHCADACRIGALGMSGERGRRHCQGREETPGSRQGGVEA